MVTNQSHFTMIAKTLFGLEKVLADELKSLGATNLELLNRAVSFKGDLALLYRCNLCCRTALKILVPIANFKAINEQELYEGIKQIHWPAFLLKSGTFMVDSSLKSPYFNHSKYVSLKTKDAIVDLFRQHFGVRPSIDLVNPELFIDVYIQNDDVVVSLNSSGQSLHKRGYRTDSTLAPINEVLAAGLIMLSEWNGKGNFTDPMCGSGTLLIEAALYAANIPPNANRVQFGFESWLDFDYQLFNGEKADALGKISHIDASIIGSDKTFKATSITRENAIRAGVNQFIAVSNKRFEDTIGEPNGGIMLINPPYGERLSIEEMGGFYKMIGDVMKQKYINYDVWIISSNIEAMKRIGLKPSRKIDLFNGSLPCKFNKYEIYSGSRRILNENS